jgi:hypothetical protein
MNGDPSKEPASWKVSHGIFWHSFLCYPPKYPQHLSQLTVGRNSFSSTFLPFLGCPTLLEIPCSQPLTLSQVSSPLTWCFWSPVALPHYPWSSQEAKPSSPQPKHPYLSLLYAADFAVCEGGVAGNDEGNKVTKTIFTGSRKFITLADSGEIISQSPEPWSVSGAGLNTYRVCPPTSYRMWSWLQETLQN